MALLLFILLLYFLCLTVEGALVGISTHDLDVLRGEDSPAARRAISLTLEIRPTLAALLLARILLLSVAGVYLAALFLHSNEVKNFLWTMSESNRLPNWLIWGVAAVLLAFAAALLFWGAQKIELHQKKEGRAALYLKRLWWFAFFWEAIFKAFTKKESKLDTLAEGKGAESNSTSIASVASEKRELELLKSIVQFSDVTVKQVMQPRSKVVSVDFKTKFPNLLEFVRQSEFSRLPVYDEDLDNITGILYVKDLISHLDDGDLFEWQPLIRTNVLMVPEAKRGSELLQEFKQQRMHMAVVVDEYGGLAGIVTMEDILEEVTGDIRDEFDEESEIRYRKIDDYNYLFDGQTLLNDVCRITGLSPGTFDGIRGASDTLAGLALELKGDIPLMGTEMEWNGFLLTVTIANKRRIEQLKLGLPKGIVPGKSHPFP